MSDGSVTEIHCQEDGCFAGWAGYASPLMNGWFQWDDEAYCPLHGPVEAFKRKRARQQEEMRAKIEAQVRARRANAAKVELSARDYREWDKFQSDLADFHKKTGNLAHSVLRLMDHRTWANIHHGIGPIEVEKANESLLDAEKKRKAAPERLAREL